jgi:hypothetical protein
MSAATKTATTPAKTKTEVWGWCPVTRGGCDRERRVEDGLVVTHRAWCGLQAGMQHCPGSGFPSARFSGGEDVGP